MINRALRVSEVFTRRSVEHIEPTIFAQPFHLTKPDNGPLAKTHHRDGMLDFLSTFNSIAKVLWADDIRRFCRERELREILPERCARKKRWVAQGLCVGDDKVEQDDRCVDECKVLKRWKRSNQGQGRIVQWHNGRVTAS